MLFANIDRLQERRERQTKIGGRGVRQRERNSVYSLHSSIRGLHLNSQSAGRCLEFSTTFSQPPPIPPPSFPKPPNPKQPPLYQHKKTQHGTFLFTLAWNTSSHATQHTHTHTPWPPPFPPLYQLKGIWLLPSDSPRLKVPFTLPQFTKRSDYGKQKYCVRAHFFCARAKGCKRHKNSRGERVPDKVTSGQTDLIPFLMSPQRQNLCCSE